MSCLSTLEKSVSLHVRQHVLTVGELSTNCHEKILVEQQSFKDAAISLKNHCSVSFCCSDQSLCVA